MRVYIDKENLLSLLSSNKGDNEKCADCLRMLQKQCDVYFNFSDTDIIDNPNAEIKERLLDFIKTLPDGKWKSWHRLTESAPPYPSRPIQDSIYNPEDKENIKAVYLIDDARADFVKKEGCLLISSLGDELNVLSTLILGDDYSFSKPIYIRDLQSWTETNTYLSPCTDIIFVDRSLVSTKMDC